ncbi:MAG: DUF4132 domain-containing protein [Deferribacteraceae bacterium]|jgi:hypothetical protein|nr:DUF4132 domain-containing protein [Deferribacteraceae bacterium]
MKYKYIIGIDGDTLHNTLGAMIKIVECLSTNAEAMTDDIAAYITGKGDIPKLIAKPEQQGNWHTKTLELFVANLTAELMDRTSLQLKVEDLFTVVFSNITDRELPYLGKLLEILQYMKIENSYVYDLRFYMLYRGITHVEPALVQDIEAAFVAQNQDIAWIFESFVKYGIAGAVAEAIREAYEATPLSFIQIYASTDPKPIISKFHELGLSIAPVVAAYANAHCKYEGTLIDMQDLFEEGEKLHAAIKGSTGNDSYAHFNSALQRANSFGSCVIYYYLAKSGQPVSVADWEQAFTRYINDDSIKLKRRSYFTSAFIGSMLGRSPLALEQAKQMIDKQAALMGWQRKHEDDKNIQTIFVELDREYAANILEIIDNYTLLDLLYYQQAYAYLLTAIAEREPETYKRIYAENEDATYHAYLAECLPKDFDIDFYISLLGDKSKKAANIAFEVLKNHPELQAKIAELAGAKKKAVREYAERLSAHYGGSSNVDFSPTDYYKKYSKPIEKALEWTQPANWPKVHEAKSNNLADEVLLKYYIYQFINSKVAELPANTQAFRALFNADELHTLVADIYSQWLVAGGEAKRKGALLLFGVHATNADIGLLQKQIEEWAVSSRSAIAAEAVKAMALSGQELALMQVDSMASKFKNKQVRKAATESFALAASAMGLTSEQLADKIVPTLGFSQHGEKVINYGTRKFIAFLTPTFVIELRDEAGKSIKSLPKLKDNETQAAKAEFTTLKKSLKTVVSTQSARLDNALSSGRTWTIAAWQQLFIENPIMHSFAMGLIWGFYKDNKLIDTFRYMADGSLASIDDTSISFADYQQHVIGLVHPLELSKAASDQWQEQLQDYELRQPLMQLSRPTFTVTDDEKATHELARFDGVSIAGITLINKLLKLGWEKGPVEDGGSFDHSYKDFATAGIRAQLTHDFLDVVLIYNEEDVAMGKVTFYKDAQPMKLAAVPVKLFSEAVYNLAEASSIFLGN